jgi:hypothetical protein
LNFVKDSGKIGVFNPIGGSDALFKVMDNPETVREILRGLRGKIII